MKKKYLIAALLAAILLLSLFACNKTDDPQKTEKITLDLSAYKVVRPEKASARLRTAAIEVRRSLYAFNADAAIEEDWLPTMRHLRYSSAPRTVRSPQRRSTPRVRTARRST